MRTLILTLTLSVLAFGADVSGKWKGSMTGRDGNTRELRFDFKAEGESLTGSMVGPMGRETAISDGKISGDELSFKVQLEFNGNALTMNYSGKVTGDEMKLKMQRDGAPRAMEVVLKKAGS